jgi:hypothetical protein
LVGHGKGVGEILAARDVMMSALDAVDGSSAATQRFGRVRSEADIDAAALKEPDL